MKKSFIVLVTGLIVTSFAIGGTSFAAQKKMRGFKWHPEQKPISVAKVQKSWAKLTKGKRGWNLYTVKDVSMMSAGMMKVMLQDETGLDHELVLTQPQWLGMSQTFVDTYKGVMVGAHEKDNEIIAFASPIRHW